MKDLESKDISQAVNLNFEDTEIAFKYKSNADLRRAYWLFKILSYSYLSKIGPPLVTFSMRLGLPIKKLIKSTIFKHFCGGENIVECENTIQQLASGKVGTILDYSIEGEDSESDFDATRAEIINTIHRAKLDERIPLTVFKVTGLGRFSLLQKLNENKVLNEDEDAEFLRIKNRIKSICETAYQENVPVMIDAEESWIQDTIDNLSLQMMSLYNTERAIVYNTYQLYRKDKLNSLTDDISSAKVNKYVLGAKLVRGAYMEKERERAQEFNYPSPIHIDKRSTDADFDSAIKVCLENLDKVAFVAGTHNEESCKFLVSLIKESDIIINHQHVYFAQLLGMSDNLSFNLAHAGYNVAKYVPYGPVEKVLPYLFRRAEENTSVSGQVGQEILLVLKEIKRRKL